FQALFYDGVEDGVQKYEVGSRLDRHVKIGGAGGFGPSRIYHDNFYALRVLSFMALNSAKEDGVASRHVGADNKKQVRQLQVGISGGRSIGAERRFIAGHGAGHAEARIGIKIIRAQKSFD